MESYNNITIDSVNSAIREINERMLKNDIENKTHNIIYCMCRCWGRTYTLHEMIDAVDAYRNGKVSYEDLMSKIMNIPREKCTQK